MHIYDRGEIVYQLPSMQRKILKRSGAVRSVDWIFITGAPAWRWLGEYVTLYRTFYSLLLKQEAVAAPFTGYFPPYHIPREGLH